MSFGSLPWIPTYCVLNDAAATFRLEAKWFCAV